MKDIISSAKKLAENHHSNQFRKGNGMPYVEHLEEVVELLVQISGIVDEQVIAAAWLHDVLEDTECTPDEIRQLCGDEVLSLVSMLTDDKSLPLSARRKKILEKMPQADERIQQIKLADITSNSTLLPKDWSEHRTIEYLSWLKNVAVLCRPSSESLFQHFLKINRFKL